jgi:hypothetical protein
VPRGGTLRLDPETHGPLSVPWAGLGRHALAARPGLSLHSACSANFMLDKKPLRKRVPKIARPGPPQAIEEESFQRAAGDENFARNSLRNALCVRALFSTWLAVTKGP